MSDIAIRVENLRKLYHIGARTDPPPPLDRAKTIEHVPDDFGISDNTQPSHGKRIKPAPAI